MSDAVSRYLEESVFPSRHTTEARRLDLQGFAKWLQVPIESLDPDSIGAVELRDYKSHLLTVKNQKASSVNRALSSIRCFLGWAKETGIRTKDVPKVKSVKIEELAPRSPDAKTVRRFLRAAESASTREHLIALLFQKTGMRVSELCSLRVANLVLDERRGGSVRVLGKGDTERNVPLSRDTVALIRDYLKERKAGPGNDAVFPGRGGRGYITTRAVQKMVDKLSGGELVCHALRHGAAYRAIHELHTPAVTVAMVLGHSVRTLSRYSLPKENDLADFAERM